MRVTVVTATTALLVVTLSPPARAAGPPSPSGGLSKAAAAKAPSPDAVPPGDRDRLLPADWRTSDDVAWTTSGDSTGLHVLTATAKTGYAWRTTASLAEPGFDADAWIGNACLTGSGRRLVVVYAPRTFTNKADLFDRGGFTAVVDLRTGTVTKLPVRSSLAYFNPGCGTGETAVLTQYGGARVDDPAVRRLESRLIAVDAAKGTVGKPVLLPTELSSPVPVDGGVVAAGAGRLVRVDVDGDLRGLAATTGVAFRLAADADGGVVFLDRHRDRARVNRIRLDRAASVTTLAEGGLTEVGLTTGARGRVFLTGTPTSVGRLPAAVRRVDAPMGSAVSTTGALALARVGWARGADPRVPVDDGGAARDVAIEARSLTRGSALSFQVTPDASMPGARAVGGRIPHPTLRSAPARSARGAVRALGSPNDPVEEERYCSVPRNDPRNQAMQPKPRQVEWAVNQAILSTLDVARPANWKNLGMPAYTPQGLFPPGDLLGGGRVPAQVMLGIIAQESNMWQAPSFVLPGATGNPLIGNFYGRDVYNESASDDWDIRWDKADCGYGVAQVTDGMRKAGFQKPGETPYDYQVQRAVALDFAANVAAGLQILHAKWNQVHAAGIRVNNGDPAKLENWFMAVWAYNSGFHPNLGNGEPWGVGWGNNPINPRYDPQRAPFLELTYNDARTPQKWPYPEKVMGWAGHPVEINESPTTMVAGYRAAWWISEAERARVKPPLDLFCDDNNQCQPGATQQPTAPGLEEEPPGPCLHQDSQGRFDLKCWYHDSVQWKGGPGTSCIACGNEVLRFDADYPYQEDGASYPPNCATMPSTWRIIDDVPNGIPSVRPDCPRSWTNTGTFTFDFPADGVGNYPAKVDLHQIGGGFGGHFYFGRTRTAEAYGGKLRVNATWRLNGSGANGWHRIKVALPDHRAWTLQADYVINLGDGRTRHRVINQAVKTNTWVDLGVFNLSGQASVTLSTVTLDGIGEDSIAFDAVAFIPTTAPTAQYVAMGDSYSSGEGVEPYDVNSDHKRDDNARNACHRSAYAYPRLVTRPGATTPIAREAAEGRASFGFIACSGALTTSITRDAVNSPPTATDAAGHTDWGSVHYRFGELTQVDTGWLDEETTLVTVSVGGNDARFGDVLAGCILVNPAEGCHAPNHRLTRESNEVVDPIALRDFESALIVAHLPIKLKAAYRAIHAKAPNAKIVVMGYPQLFPDRGTPIGCGVVTRTTQRFLNNLSGMLSRSIARSIADLYAEGMDIIYVDPTDTWRGGVGDSSHFACPTGSAGSWTNLVINWSETGSGRNVPGAGSFHPTQAGQAALATLASQALWAPSSINTIADAIQTHAAANNVTLTDAQAEHAARRCRAVTRQGGVLGDPCVNLPIFFPTVTNAGDAARNDNEGITKNPVWALLRYASNSEMDKINNRNWYNLAANRPNPCDRPPPPGTVNPQCDEYPFYSSELAGLWDEFLGETSPVSSNLKLVAEAENNAEGTKLRGFYSRCRMQSATYDSLTQARTGTGSRYLVVPLLDAGLAPDTFYICPPQE
jgi:hypothetical protein